MFFRSSSAIYMFLRFHPQRFICFSDLILSDLYVFTISSSAIHMFFRSHPQIRPQGIDSRAMLLRAGPSCHICWAVLGSPGRTPGPKPPKNQSLSILGSFFTSLKSKRQNGPAPASPFTATILNFDLEVGSQGYPFSNCLSVMPCARRAASQRSPLRPSQRCACKQPFPSPLHDSEFQTGFS